MAQADGDICNWYRAHANNFDVVVHDPKVWVTQIQGPKSMNVLAEVIDGDFPNPWNYFDIAEVSICGEKVIISRTGFSNELGWEIYLKPENDCQLIGRKIWKVGLKYSIMLCATPVFRARRIEAGLLSAGADFNEFTNPYEVGLGRFVDLNKENFIGKSALVRVDKKNKLWGLKVKGGIAKKGKFFSEDGRCLGKVTSSTWSPYLECGVALIFVDNNDISPGSIISLEGVDKNYYEAQICELPMYDEKGLIVRGKNKIIPTKPEPWVA